MASPQIMLEAHSPASSIASNNSSVIEDVSWDYVIDEQGDFKRTSKGKASRNAASESPPTPNSLLIARDSPMAKDIFGPHGSSESDLISLNSPLRRLSLTRSESAYSALALSQPDLDNPPHRSFQRVASGPTLSTIPLAPIPKRAGLRRDDLAAKRGPDERAHVMRSEREQQLYPDEKENMARDLPSVEDMYGNGVRSSISGAAPIRAGPPSRAPAGATSASAPRMRQVSSSSSSIHGRGNRLLKGQGVKLAFGRISEVEDGRESSSLGNASGEETDPAEDDYLVPEANSLALSQSGATRPRRSHSLSDALADDHYQPGARGQPQGRSVAYNRPGTSLGINRDVPPLLPNRRVPAVEQDHKRYQEQERRTHSSSYGRQSPTHIPSHSRPAHQGHRRRESDTLRNVSPAPAEVPPKTSPTLVNNVRHRRSPTAPEPPTTSDVLHHGVVAGPPNGRTWSPGDREGGLEYEREKEREQERYKQQKVQSSPPATRQITNRLHAVALAHAQVSGKNSTLTFVVNKKSYVRLDMVGRGGSSRVYRVMNAANEIYAIKRVALDKTDAETMSGYMNEIALLKRLEGNSRIIRLLDSELKGGPGGTKGHLLLVMECGEIDLARLLSERLSEGLNMIWVAYYWQQMLQAVHIIHEEKIVHSDLKPANFVLVKGQLKLIDFGIANAIANDTTNIQRDHQVGTINYMSPEAIELPDGMRRLKVGRASDIWSLGCILYQMVYGHPPFQHLSIVHKMKAIPDAKHVIDFPEYSTPPPPKNLPPNQPPPNMDHLKVKIRVDAIEAMRSCLTRNPKQRMTIPALLEQDWLVMRDPAPPKPHLAHDETIINPHYMKQLIQYGISLGQAGRTVDDSALDTDAMRLVADLRRIIIGEEPPEAQSEDGETS